MMIVSTTGYIVTVLGPYLADTKNNDAKILNHIVATNAEDMKQWVTENDVFVVDRGFRDSSEVLSDLGVKMEMPAFLSKGSKQHSTEESNSSRLVTKVLLLWFLSLDRSNLLERIPCLSSIIIQLLLTFISTLKQLRGFQWIYAGKALCRSQTKHLFDETIILVEKAISSEWSKMVYNNLKGFFIVCRAKLFRHIFIKLLRIRPTCQDVLLWYGAGVCLSVRPSVHKACKHYTDWTVLIRTVKLGAYVTYDKTTNPIDFQGHCSRPHARYCW